MKAFAFLGATLGLLGALASRADSSGRNAGGLLDVSLVQLIANSAAFDDQRVRVIGFCWLEHEGTALYLHREDFEQGILGNALWLNVGWPLPTGYDDLKGGYVIVEGTFTAKERGHFGMYAGSIKGITRLKEWHGRSEAPPPPKPSEP